MGVHIVSVLADIHSQLTSTSQVQLQRTWKRLPDPQTDPGRYVVEVVSQWSAGHSPRPATWTELLQVIQDIGQQQLSQQIEAYMKGTCSDM